MRIAVVVVQIYRSNSRHIDIVHWCRGDVLRRTSIRFVADRPHPFTVPFSMPDSRAPFY